MITMESVRFRGGHATTYRRKRLHDPPESNALVSSICGGHQPTQVITF
jgi:hypothetical protein